MSFYFLFLFDFLFLSYEIAQIRLIGQNMGEWGVGS
jgi:hypothetical protein